jgi:hypothetical protein
MPGKPPAFQFYARDWLTDTQLTACSTMTRGIWIDMLAQMWLAPTRGVLYGNIDMFVKLTRSNRDEIVIALRELHDTGTANVTHRRRNGVPLYRVENRRMLREGAMRKANNIRTKRSRSRRAKASKNAPKCNGHVTRPSDGHVTGHVTALSHDSASSSALRQKKKSKADVSSAALQQPKPNPKPEIPEGFYGQDSETQEPETCPTLPPMWPPPRSNRPPTSKLNGPSSAP